MSANHHHLRGLRRPCIWLLSLLFIIVPTLSPAHAVLENAQSDSDVNDINNAQHLLKLGSSGEALDANAQQWSCVKDESTGLTWEKRDPTSALHGHDSFIWYQPEQTIAGVPRAHPDIVWAESTCYGFNPDDPSSFCNTSAYAERVNQSNYCGFSDWRLPNVTELLSLVDPVRETNNLSPLLDTQFFPFHDPFLYWTDTVNDDGVVLTVFTDNRVFANSERSDSISIRLVRGHSYQ